MTDKETKSIERKIRREQKGIENHLVPLLDTELGKRPREVVPGFTAEQRYADMERWARSIVYRAKRIQEATERLDELCRQRDGRPTRREQGIADSNRMEANMAAEAHRERREWAQDEASARYDSINEQDQDCGPTYDPSQE
mgnify:CR=1 FL=1